MRRYGTRKTRTRVAGHQDCGTCHPEQKSYKDRARREGEREAHVCWKCCNEIVNEGQSHRCYWDWEDF